MGINVGGFELVIVLVFVVGLLLAIVAIAKSKKD